MQRYHFFPIFVLILLIAGCSAVAPRNTVPLTVAVFELEDVTADGQLAYAGELLSAQIGDILGKLGKYTIVERSRLLRILEEQQLSAVSLTDQHTRLRLGELIGATYMVFGGYQTLGEKVRIDIRIVEVETGKIRNSVKKVVDSTDLQSLLYAAKSAAEEL